MQERERKCRMREDGLDLYTSLVLSERANGYRKEILRARGQPNMMVLAVWHYSHLHLPKVPHPLRRRIS